MKLNKERFYNSIQARSKKNDRWGDEWQKKLAGEQIKIALVWKYEGLTRRSSQLDQEDRKEE